MHACHRIRSCARTPPLPLVLGGVLAYSRKVRGGLRLLSTPQAAVPNAAGIRMLDRAAECIALLRRRSPLAPEGSNPSASACNHHRIRHRTRIRGWRFIIMFKVCSTAGCPNLVQSGSKCRDCKRQAERERRPHGNPYATSGHRRCRRQVLARDPRCVCTGDCGRHEGMCGAPSTIDDHWPYERKQLIEMDLDPNDPKWSRGICKPCHDAKTARTNVAGFRLQQHL